MSVSRQVGLYKFEPRPPAETVALFREDSTKSEKTVRLLDPFLEFCDEQGIEDLNAVSIETVDAYIEWYRSQIEAKSGFQLLDVRPQVEAVESLFRWGIATNRLAYLPFHTLDYNHSHNSTGDA